MDWWMDLLTTYIRHSELHVITALSLISTLYKSPQHPLFLFLAYCAFNSHSLATASKSGDSSAFRAYLIAARRISRNWTLVNCRINYITISSQPNCRARLNCQPSTKWVPGWRPFHPNLLVLSSQADFQLTTELSHLPTSYFTQLNSIAKSKSELLYDRRFTANQFVLAWSPLRPTTRDFFNWTLAVIVLM
jgi:hypothetical protein